MSSLRVKFINIIKTKRNIVSFCYFVFRVCLKIISFFVPVKKKTIIFASFGGRKYDDSPKAIYEGIIKDNYFDDWNFVWAFCNPNQFDIPRGEKIKIDTPIFFLKLVSSQVWVSNSGMDRGINFNRKGIIKIETWHGSVLKKGCGEENNNLKGKKELERLQKKKKDNNTIRCTQSDIDTEVFSRIFWATKSSFVEGFPRNDILVNATNDEISDIRRKIGIPKGKNAILYAPTYREYLMNSEHDIYLSPPINLEKWKEILGDKYVLLVRAHYAITASMNIKNDSFVRDFSTYPCLSDLLLACDILISDYSSIFHDFSILGKPMFCFAYDYDDFNYRRGFLIDIKKDMPFDVDENEDTLLDHIVNMNIQKCREKSIMFHQKYSPYCGHGTENVINEVKRRLQ